MNVAALLQDSPSEDTNNRRRPPADNPSQQRTWPPPSSPSLQQQPSSAPTSAWGGPTSSSAIHDRPPTHWQERDNRTLSNPTLVGPGTGVPPSPYIHPDEKREREQRDRADMDIIRAVASSRPTPHSHHHVHTHQQQVPMVQPAQPQKQFQHQFHTQFVSGLTVGNGSPSPVVDTAGGSGNKKERDGRRSGGRDKEKERERERDRDRDRGLGRDRERERELGRDRDRDRERERDREMARDRDRERERERELAGDRDRDRDARRERELGGGTEYPGPSGYDHRHGIPQQHPPHHTHQYRIPLPLPPPPPPPPPLHLSHSHPPQPNHQQLPQQHPQHHPQQHNSNQHSSPELTGLAPGGNGNGANDNPPGIINSSPTVIDDWDLDIAIEEEGRSWNRARVGVHLGTFVFPKLPFPYFFELGSGLVAVKDREEQRERVKEENERKDREREEEREREKEKKKANGEKEKEKDDNIAMKIEEGEIIEKKVDKEVEKTSPDTEKKDRGIKIQLQKDDSNDLSILAQGKVDSPVSIQLQQDSQLPQQPLLDIETRTTIIIPTGCIPVEKPLRPKLWGGGGFDPRPRPPPLRTRRSKNGGLNGKGKHQQQLQLQSSRPSSTKPSLLSASANTSLNSSSSSNTANNNNPSALPTSAPSSSKLQIRTRRPRRIYTDDSDIFLCAIHSGWVTWSGARKARLKGRDMRIEVRMLRCAGAGGENESLGGTGEGESERRVEEEMIGRFVGGYGERCFNPLGKSGRVAGEEGGSGGVGEEEEEEEEEEEGEGGLMPDDPDDDGRSLVSAAWGSGHDGSAIEIVNVEFVEKGTARSACGLGRRNRSQRLLEYAERRASVLGYPCKTPALSRLAGRKRRRGWDSCSWPVHHPRRLPNATVLDVIQEVEEEEGEAADDQLGFVNGLLRVQEEDRLMDIRTMVFGMGVSGDLRVGYKYVPNVLKEILFPSPWSSSDQPPPRKRRRTLETEDVEMESTDNNNVTSTSSVPQHGDTLRPVILETVKESYLLSPSILSSSSSVDARQTYDIALILEAEVVVEEEAPLVESERNAILDGDNDTPSPTKPFHAMNDLSTPEKTAEPPQIVAQQSKTSGSVRKPVDEILLPSSSPPTDSLTLEDETAKPQFAVQVLQRNLTRDMFRFVNEGVYVKEDGGGGMETEWVIQVKDWKWAPKSLSSRERI